MLVDIKQIIDSLNGIGLSVDEILWREQYLASLPSGGPRLSISEDAAIPVEIASVETDAKLTDETPNPILAELTRKLSQTEPSASPVLLFHRDSLDPGDETPETFPRKSEEAAMDALEVAIPAGNSFFYREDPSIGITAVNPLSQSNRNGTSMNNINNNINNNNNLNGSLLNNGTFVNHGPNSNQNGSLLNHGGWIVTRSSEGSQSASSYSSTAPIPLNPTTPTNVTTNQSSTSTQPSNQPSNQSSNQPSNQPSTGSSTGSSKEASKKSQKAGRLGRSARDRRAAHAEHASRTPSSAKQAIMSVDQPIAPLRLQTFRSLQQSQQSLQSPWAPRQSAASQHSQHSQPGQPGQGSTEDARRAPSASEAEGSASEGRANPVYASESDEFIDLSQEMIHQTLRAPQNAELPDQHVFVTYLHCFV